MGGPQSTSHTRRWRGATLPIITLKWPAWSRRQSRCRFRLEATAQAFANHEALLHSGLVGCCAVGRGVTERHCRTLEATRLSEVHCPLCIRQQSTDGAGFNRRRLLLRNDSHRSGARSANHSCLRNEWTTPPDCAWGPTALASGDTARIHDGEVHKKN